MWFWLTAIFILAGFIAGARLSHNPWYGVAMIVLFGIACGFAEIATRG